MFGAKNDIAIMKQWTWTAIEQDETLERDLRALLYFHECLLLNDLNLLWSTQGCSFSQRGTNTLLVVKGMSEGLPYVAFVTERTPTGCIVTFGRQWLQGRVKWHADKFR